MSFDKVDRALEMRVIDWLQWGEFEDRLDKPSMPALALDLIAKRKAENDSLRKLAEVYEEALDTIAEQADMHDNPFASQIATEARAKRAEIMGEK